MARRPAVDPVRLEVYHHLLAAVAEEAGAVLQRSALSPNIRERRDLSCALFDADGRLVAQAAHIPVHLGSAGASVAAVRARLALEPGDVVLLNDPYDGGTHLPDLTMVRPLFLRGRAEPDWFAVCRAHHADVGGATPGSMGIAADLHGEGLCIPPVKLRARGEPVAAVFDLLRANVRRPDERLVDLAAQEAALRRAEQRLAALCDEHGGDEIATYAAHLMDYADRVLGDVLRGLPDGAYRAEDALEDDGAGHGPLPIRLALTLRRGRATFDFRGSAPQAAGGVNANRNIVLAAAAYCLRCLCPARLPTNEGLYRRLEVLTEPGSLLEPQRPAPVAGGNVETSQRIVDVCLAALAQAVPDRVPAASAGTMSNLAVGGDGFAFYETLPGGAGAAPGAPGASGVQTHMTNTRNTPVEEFEHRFPVRVAAWTLRRGSGGRGAARGGDGVRKELVFDAPASVSLFAERHRQGPAGLHGGGDGRPGRAAVRRAGGKGWRRLPAKGTWRLGPGDALRIETPGGGGCGEAGRGRR